MTTNAVKNAKKANLLDQNSIKNILDECVKEVVISRGYREDVRLSNVKLLLGLVIIAIALAAQFYWKEFPENRSFLIGCILSYVVVNGLLQLIIYSKGRNAIMFTYPLEGSFTGNGLVISSKLPRSSDLYTVTISTADTKSMSANKPVKLTKRVTNWFTKDGVLVHGLLWNDIEGPLNDYAQGHKRTK